MITANIVLGVLQKVLKVTGLFALVAVIAIPFWPYSPDRSINRKLSHILNTYYADQSGIPNPIRVELSDLTDFEWDTVHVIGHYSGCFEVLKVVGPWVHACRMIGHDFFHILVFELDDSIVEYAQVERLLQAPGSQILSLPLADAKLEAITHLSLESEYWPKIREGLYVNWLIPSGHGELYCTACVELPRRQSRCTEAVFREKGLYCDLTASYSLPVVTPKLSAELYKLAKAQTE